MFGVTWEILRNNCRAALLAFFVVNNICSSKVNKSTWTLRSYSHVVSSRIEVLVPLLLVYVCLGFDLPICITMQLHALNPIPHLMGHLTSAFMQH